MEPTGPMAGGGFGFWHALMLAVYAVALCWPVARVLGRAGYSGWWSLLALVPVFNLVALWIFAYADWPRLPGSGRGGAA